MLLRWGRYTAAATKDLPVCLQGASRLMPGDSCTALSGLCGVRLISFGSEV